MLVSLNGFDLLINPKDAFLSDAGMEYVMGKGVARTHSA
jgi:hypothetical protein